MISVLAESLARQRFQMQILGSFAALALVLAAVGLYGVLAYVVTESRIQFGIRLALGAQPSTIFRAIVGRAFALTAAGVALGALGCVPVRRVMATLLIRHWRERSHDDSRPQSFCCQPRRLFSPRCAPMRTRPNGSAAGPKGSDSA
jgi:ABC-type antimicrobial peptide transport system permease subunit